MPTDESHPSAESNHQINGVVGQSILRSGPGQRIRSTGCSRIPVLVSAALAAAALVMAPADLPAAAEPSLGIAVVVNDDIITVRDIDNRITLFLATSSLQDEPENRRRFAPIALRSLIDDKLKTQEAERLGVRASREDSDRALAQIAAQLRTTPEQLPEVLATRGVRIESLREQVEAEIAWTKAVSRAMQGKITVTDEEIDARIERMTEEAGKTEYRVAEIFLPVDDSRGEAEVQKLAERLVQEIARGANFAAVARNFSAAGSAAVGGDLGYLRPEQLPPELQAVVEQLEPGRLSPPIRTGGGYYILALVDRRVAVGPKRGRILLTLRQLQVAVPPRAAPAEVQARAQRVNDLAAGAANCSELEAKATGGEVTSRSLGPVEIDQLEDSLARSVRSLPAGGRTEPARTAGGVGVVMVCERREEGSDADMREGIRRTLNNERLAAAARRMLRDLQREAFVDVRR
jgi:peptidyl-prolyl cis-trans isomerase SurA